MDPYRIRPDVTVTCPDGSVWTDRLFRPTWVWCRQIQRQYGGAARAEDLPYDNSHWLVAGHLRNTNESYTEPYLVYLQCLVWDGANNRYAEASYEVPLVGKDIDLSPHDSFVRGEMPPAVYADWIEETNLLLPAAAFDLLRYGI